MYACFFYYRSAAINRLQTTLIVACALCLVPIGSLVAAGETTKQFQPLDVFELEYAADPRIAGCARGIVDPHHRVILDTPGQRFSLGGQLRVDLFATMRAQF